MMGHQPQSQEKLFYTGFNLSQRIPKNHILRKISNMVEFDFVYKEVKGKYGTKGDGVEFRRFFFHLFVVKNVKGDVLK